MRQELNFLALLLVGVFALVGCDEVTEPGGPGAADTDGDAILEGVDDEKTFTLHLPGDLDMTAGNSEEIEIEAHRGDEFNQTIEVEVLPLADGVTVEPMNFTIAADQEEAKLTVNVAVGAATGETSINLVGRPEMGEEVTGSIPLHITAAEGNDDDNSLADPDLRAPTPDTTDDVDATDPADETDDLDFTDDLEENTPSVEDTPSIEDNPSVDEAPADDAADAVDDAFDGDTADDDLEPAIEE